MAYICICNDITTSKLKNILDENPNLCTKDIIKRYYEFSCGKCASELKKSLKDISQAKKI